MGGRTEGEREPATGRAWIRLQDKFYLNSTSTLGI
jgi:hypothetical protein